MLVFAKVREITRTNHFHQYRCYHTSNNASKKLIMVWFVHTNVNTKELMHCHCGTNNRAPRLTFTNPCKPEVRPGAREESASPAWLAAPAMNARNTTSVYMEA